MTNMLSTPAIFFWGIGTSDIGKVSVGVSETSSAAALAVASIVIPGLDASFANQRVEQWLDKVNSAAIAPNGMHSRALLQCVSVRKKQPRALRSDDRMTHSLGSYRWMMCVHNSFLSL